MSVRNSGKSGGTMRKHPVKFDGVFFVDWKGNGK